MNNPSSPLDTLRQLKEMLDAGALTPAEFEALKQRLVFTTPPASLAAAAPEPLAPAGPPPAAAPGPPAPPAAFSPPPAASFPPAFSEATAPEPLPPTGRAFEPELYAAAPPETDDADADPEPVWTGQEFPARAEEPPARNSLALILSIGGVLVFLAVVAYLSLNPTPSERLSSTSLTAADSVAETIETGPQAEPLTPLATAAPETIRVAPTNPAPPVPARPTPPVRDSATVVAPPTTPDSTANQ